MSANENTRIRLMRERIQSSLLAALASARVEGGNKIVEDLFKQLMTEAVSISFPSCGDSKGVIKLRVGARGGGVIRNFGNVRFNLTSVVSLFGAAVAGVSGAVQQPWLAPFVFLSLVANIKSIFEHEISEEVASVLWAMLEFGESKLPMTELKILKKINQERKRKGSGKITRKELREKLTVLHKLGCVSPSEQGNSCWKIVDIVHIDFR